MIDHKAAKSDAERCVEQGVYPDFEDTKHICAAYLDFEETAYNEVRARVRELANECGRSLCDNGKALYEKYGHDLQTKLEGRIREHVGMAYMDIVELLFMDEQEEKREEVIRKITESINKAMRDDG